MSGPELMGLCYRIFYFPGVMAARAQEQKEIAKRNIRDIHGKRIEAEMVSEDHMARILAGAD